MNPYLYCRAGPVTLSDPSGLEGDKPEQSTGGLPDIVDVARTIIGLSVEDVGAFIEAHNKEAEHQQRAVAEYGSFVHARPWHDRENPQAWHRGAYSLDTETIVKAGGEWNPELVLEGYRLTYEEDSILDVVQFMNPTAELGVLAPGASRVVGKIKDVGGKVTGAVKDTVEGGMAQLGPQPATVTGLGSPPPAANGAEAGTSSQSSILKDIGDRIKGVFGIADEPPPAPKPPAPSPQPRPASAVRAQGNTQVYTQEQFDEAVTELVNAGREVVEAKEAGVAAMAEGGSALREAAQTLKAAEERSRRAIEMIDHIARNMKDK